MEAVLGVLIVAVGFSAALAYPALQVYTALKFPGFWRLAALLPVPAMGYVVIVTIAAFVQQSNLWPILLIFVGPVATVYLALLTVVFFTTRSAREAPLKG